MSGAESAKLRAGWCARPRSPAGRATRAVPGAAGPVGWAACRAAPADGGGAACAGAGAHRRAGAEGRPGPAGGGVRPGSGRARRRGRGLLGVLVGVRGEQHVDVGPGAGLVDVVVLGHPARLGGLAPPVRVPHGLGQRAHRALGRRIRQYAAPARRAVRRRGRAGHGLATRGGGAREVSDGGRAGHGRALPPRVRGAGLGQRGGQARDLQVHHDHRLGHVARGGRLPDRPRQLRGGLLVDGRDGRDDNGMAQVVGQGPVEGSAEVGRLGGRGQVERR